MKPTCYAALFATLLLIVSQSRGQITLSLPGYEQRFDALSSGLPLGWAVYSGASVSSLGIETTFTSSPTTWSNTSTVFRNIASFDGSSPTDNTAAQSANLDRALGWRPNNASTRNGAVTFHIANTVGLRDFGVSVTLFTGNNVGDTNQSYSFEYRLGDIGDFVAIGTYTTSAPFDPVELSASPFTLSVLDDQSNAVYFRIRGTTPSGTTSLDTLGIDNFSLTYSAVPEPSTYAALFGGLSLVGAILYRRRRKQV